MPTDADDQILPPDRSAAQPTTARSPRRRSVSPAHERREGLAAAAGRTRNPGPATEVPTGTVFGRIRFRNAFSITSLGSDGGREHHLVTAPKRGPERRKACDAIMAVLRRAERQQHLVSILVTLGDYTQLRVGSSRGQDPSLALLQCRQQGDDPFKWCAREHLRENAELVRADTIIAVAVESWLPSTGVGTLRASSS